MTSRTMKFLLAALLLLIALALAPFAWDWRSPFLAEFRPWALLGLIVIPLSVILAELWLLVSSRSEQQALRALCALGLLAAVLVLSVTLALEARFRWDRYQVLHADPVRLERLGRHFIVGYRSLAEIRELVRLRAIAGVFISGSNARGKSISDIAKQIKSLQQIRQVQNLPPLWIATDQEGGPVSRLSPPLTRLPALSEIVTRYSDMNRLQRAVRELATEQARELAQVGVNLNFAPVVDVNHNVKNPGDRYTRIYERAISADPAVVAQVAAWYCAALEDAGVHCTLKHFPGLGRVSGDTHLHPANLATPLTELTKADWVPFRALMRDGKAFTMLAHVRLTAIDSKRPASMSPGVISGLLRDDWKYDGVLITDNFSMMAVYRSRDGMDDGSIEALNAGVDLILVSWDPDQYYRIMYALLKADRQGRLDRRMLRKSSQRLARAVESLIPK
ncbi:MAG: glycoside hydrolase family 3 N-terminal domain-containing protein [Desulfomonilaceae bacterium]